MGSIGNAQVARCLLVFNDEKCVTTITSLTGLYAKIEVTFTPIANVMMRMLKKMNVL